MNIQDRKNEKCALPTVHHRKIQQKQMEHLHMGSVNSKIESILDYTSEENLQFSVSLGMWTPAHILV